MDNKTMGILLAAVAAFVVLNRMTTGGSTVVVPAASSPAAVSNQSLINSLASSGSPIANMLGTLFNSTNGTPTGTGVNPATAQQQLQSLTLPGGGNTGTSALTLSNPSSATQAGDQTSGGVDIWGNSSNPGGFVFPAITAAPQTASAPAASAPTNFSAGDLTLFG